MPRVRQHGLPVRDRLGARGFVAAALLTAATLAVYWGAWRFEFVNFDDDIAVLQNPRIAEPNAGAIRSIAGLFRFERAREYLPVRDGSYLLDRTLWGGLDPGGFHLTNLALHVAAGLLLMRLATALGASLEAGVLASAVFLLHPMQTESVAWVSGRKDLVAALFALASWLAHERGRRVASAALFLAAALSKATVVPLPIVFFAADALRDRSARPGRPSGGSGGRALDERGAIRRRLARIAPHLAIAMLVAILQIITSAGAGMLRSGEARGPLASLLLAAKLPFLYLANIVWPADLHLLYSPAIPDPRAPADWLPLFALAIVIGLLARARGRRALFAIGGIAFFVLLAPTLGLIPFQLLMADRYAYLPMAGVALAISGLFPSGSEARGLAGKAALAAAILLAIPLGLVARREALAWRDSETLWTRELSRDATHADAWLNLGTHYLNEARALRDQRDPSAAQDRARLAAANLERAVALGAPVVSAHVNWSLSASLAGDHRAALRAIDVAREAAPSDPLVRYNSACVRAQAGEIEQALDDLNDAIDSDGDFTNPDRIASDPDLAPLRSDPRFAALLKKARFHSGWIDP
jgi:protein O-mannosyl-transferase